MGTLAGRLPGAKPVWDLAQWSSRHPLPPGPPETLASGAWRYANAAKTITISPPGTADADVSFAANASIEYGDRARRQGEPWVHWLAQQEFADPPSMAALRTARLHVEARLKSARKIATPDDSPGLHAAQFQMFFTIQNRNRQSPGYGQYLWFGVPIYDDRHRTAPAHQAPDTGGTRMFIYTVAGDTFTRHSAHDREWLVIDHDLLPRMRAGLAAAWQRGFLKDSQALADYRLTGMNLGWELPGIFDVAMQVRNLRLRVTPAGPGPHAR